jgi:hypothetical protein
MNIYIALLHYPVKNKKGEIVATSITGFDIHDISRTAVTFGINKYFVVNPMPQQMQFAKRLTQFWSSTKSKEFNWTRAEAMKRVEVTADLETALKAIKKAEKMDPIIVATSAQVKNGIGYEAMRKIIEECKGKKKRPVLILFGTGWGMSDALLKKADYILKPIYGVEEYNHLSVRSAVAIILDRLLRRKEND